MVSRFHVVPPEELLSEEEVSREQWHLFSLYSSLSSADDAVEFLAKRGLVRNELRCDREACNNRPCSLILHGDGSRQEAIAESCCL